MTNGSVVAAGSVAKKCLSAVGHVAAAGCVASERLPTSGRVRAAGCATKERRITSGRVPDAGGEAEERKITLSGVGIGISSVGGWDNPECFRRWAKRREANHQQYCCKCLCRVPILHNLTFFHLFWPSVISHRERIISSHSPIYFRKFWPALQKKFGLFKPRIHAGGECVSKRGGLQSAVSLSVMLGGRRSAIGFAHETHHRHELLSIRVDWWLVRFRSQGCQRRARVYGYFSSQSPRKAGSSRKASQ